jgi:enamine deaminase RidA (YjgF/YER057c/UK114 family)
MREAPPRGLPRPPRREQRSMRSASDETRFITTPEIWRVPTFSTAVAVPPRGAKVYVTAQGAVDRAGRVVGEGDPRRQIDEAFANLGRALAGAGIAPRHIVRVMHFFVDYEVDLLKTIFRNLSEMFEPDAMPASTGLIVAGFAEPGAKYRILAEGFVPDPQQA